MNGPNGKKILIVDDEIDIVELLAEEFDDCGYHSTMAYSGNEAIKKLEAKSFDIILSDFRMPDGNGMDLLKFVNKMELNIKPKFFFLSGYSDVSIEELIDAGALEFFSKPFQIEDIVSEIEKHFLK